MNVPGGSPTSVERVQRVVDEQFGGKPIMQVAFLVKSLPEAIAAWRHIYSDDEWKVFTYGPDNVRTLSYHGAPGTFRFRVALVGTSPQLELIQALSGPSVYDEWIARRGYGIHHIAFPVHSIATTVKAFKDVGIQAPQSLTGHGLKGDGGSAYFALDGYDVLVEALEVPRLRRPSEPVPK